MIEEFICRMCSFSGDYVDAPEFCPKCFSKHYTITFREKERVKSKFANLGYKDSPRYSVSLGVFDEDLAEAKRVHPQCEWKKFGSSWRPLIKNRTDKKRMLKQAKMNEYQ